MCFMCFFQYKSSRKSSSGNENNEVRKECNISNYLKHLFSYVIGSIRVKDNPSCYLLI